MKLNKIYKFLLASVAVFAVGFFACNEFEIIEQPETVQANKEVTITAKIKIVPETEEKNAVLAFGMYAPKSLDLANNATVKFSTLNFAEVLGADYGVTDVTDEILKVIPAEEKAPHSPFTFEGTVPEENWIPWADAFHHLYGDGDNYLMGIADQMEWVVWESANHFYFSDVLADGSKHEVPLYAELTITFNSGEYNQDCHLGYAFCNKIKGFYNEQDHLSDGYWRHFVVEGGIEPEVPAAEPLMTPIQADFRYGDLFGLEFTSAGTALEGETNIYLCGKATYDGGQEVEISTAVASNLLKAVGDSGNTFEKYIFPLRFFGLSADAKIESMVVWFTNADGSIVVDKNSDGNAFAIGQYDVSIQDTVTE